VIALLDYKAGNLTSVKKALAAIGASVFVPGAPGELAGAHGIIVPGVGHFGATTALDAAWVSAVLDRVEQGKPLLGICLGMQWLFEGSEESPELRGVGLLSGTCVRLNNARPDADRTSFKVPHVGWNTLKLESRESWILDGVPDGAQVYFTHSYVAPVTEVAVAVTEHGVPFAAVVQRAHVAGVQFHPEKSGDVGLRILRNFIALAG
jgi:imidazole glycerol-phosphate synthase subunit HisH